MRKKPVFFWYIKQKPPLHFTILSALPAYLSHDVVSICFAVVPGITATELYTDVCQHVISSELESALALLHGMFFHTFICLAARVAGTFTLLVAYMHVCVAIMVCAFFFFFYLHGVVDFFSIFVTVGP